MDCDKSRPVIHKYGNDDEFLWLFEKDLDLINYLAVQNPDVDFNHLRGKVQGYHKAISMKSFFHSQTNEEMRCHIKSIPVSSTVKEIKIVLASESAELNSKKI